MKVYLQKGEYVSSMILGLFITILFIGISILLWWIMLVYKAKEYETIINGENFIVLPFALMFSVVSLILIYGFFRSPKKYKAKLVKKEQNAQDGHFVTNMTFELVLDSTTQKKATEKVYNCFTYDSNGLIVDKTYNVYIKEFNWKITKVDEIPLD